MNKSKKKPGSRTPARETGSVRAIVSRSSSQAEFDEVVRLIEAARSQAVFTINTLLIDLYWSIGKYISQKVVLDGWGKGSVEALAFYIQRRQPSLTGFSASNLWRMRQFYETYQAFPKLAAVLRELSWTHNLLILGKCKREEERGFYLRLAIDQKWTSRELERQINTALFERTVLKPQKLSASLRELHPTAADIFKDSYLLEFLGLPSRHSENDL